MIPFNVRGRSLSGLYLVCQMDAARKDLLRVSTSGDPGSTSSSQVDLPKPMKSHAELQNCSHSELVVLLAELFTAFAVCVARSQSKSLKTGWENAKDTVNFVPTLLSERLWCSGPAE